MQLLNLLRDVEFDIVSGEADELDISGVSYDSRKVSPGNLFVCIKGAKFDGHDAAADVAEKGAAVIVTERGVSLPKDKNIVEVRVKNSREALAYISAAWFKHPAVNMKITGITGTKGKTTTTYLAKAILEKAGHKVGLIGTIETIIGDDHIPAKNTTPESYVLQETFRKMADKGIDTVVMEVSSQALMMDRTKGFDFDLGVFTNIEPDHIGPDEHKDFEDYLRCKSLLFRQCRHALLNGDDPHLKEILEGARTSVVTFGLKEKNTLGQDNDIRAVNEKLIKKPGELGVMFDMQGKYNYKDLEVGTPGEFSVYNALCAASIGLEYGAGEEAVREALKEEHVRGRIEAVKVSDDFSLVIDYAHNAMALKSLLVSLF